MSPPVDSSALKPSIRWALRCRGGDSRDVQTLASPSRQSIAFELMSTPPESVSAANP
jgi:hypothetical protein